VDNFRSRDDIRVHTFGGFAQGREVPAEGFCRGQADPHRRREVSRSGSGAAARLCGRCPVGVRRLSRLGAVARIRTPKTRTTWNAHPQWSLTPSCANCVAVNKRPTRSADHRRRRALHPTPPSSRRGNQHGDHRSL